MNKISKTLCASLYIGMVKRHPGITAQVVGGVFHTDLAAVLEFYAPGPPGGCPHRVCLQLERDVRL